MSTFMEHIHRETGTRPLFDDTASWPPWSTTEPEVTTEASVAPVHQETE
jgi:hypothetical protein